MQKLHSSIVIDAPKEKVWDTMLADKTYRQWTSVFAPGSRYEGSWDEGSKIRFFDGEGNGMVSTIAQSRPHEFISIKHIGMIQDGVEDTTSDEVKKWAGAFENYTFKERAGSTEVLVDMDMEDEYKEMFERTWPEALARLKDIAEGKGPQAIVVSTMVNVPVAKVWKYWNEPEHIVHWAFASDDWEAAAAENDLRAGGKFKTVMAAKDKSASFDFSGTYTAVKEHSLIEYDMDDGRHVKVWFNQFPEGVNITEIFDPEKENPEDVQRDGWQAILDNFKRYIESQNWIEKLEQEGFTDVRVCPIPPNQDLPEHKHDERTVHVILDGGLTIIDTKGTKVFRSGDRVDFPAGTTHKARGETDKGTMVIGVKTNK